MVRFLALGVAFAVLAATPSFGLEPKDVFLISNRNVPASKAVAEHYVAKRGVPEGHIIELDLPTGEDIKREDYNTKLVLPLREALKDRKAQAKVLLCVYGVPLRVEAQVQTNDEKAQAERLKSGLEEARKKLQELEKDKKTPEADKERRHIEELDRWYRGATHPESRACVDSELMLLWWPRYPLERWIMNPHYFRASEKYRTGVPPVVLTSRLDGPTPEIAKRLVDDAIEVEAKGLDGLVCIDARGIRFDPNGSDSGTGYSGYDESMRETARLLEKAGLKTMLDDKPELLAPGSAKDVAFYCGWYSLAKFIDSCEFKKGAIAWHLASAEAVSLRKADSTLWCPNLLMKGVAATLGPVAEPYTVGFPKPAEFFGFLATGEFTLVECYAKSMLFCSWQTVLVGDPLYTPFKKNPKLKVADVVPSPAGGRSGAP